MLTTVFIIFMNRCIMFHQSNNGGQHKIIPFFVTSIALSITWLLWLRTKKRRSSTAQYQTYEDCIGNTPLIHLPKLSSMLGNNTHIYVKMESFNPGGTGKDRAALFMLRHAEANGDLPTPSTLGDNHGPFDGDSSFPSSSASIDTKEETHFSNTRENSGGNTKDNTATVTNDLSSTINTAVQRSKTGGVVVEGTSGSTGISLSTLSRQRGHSTIIVMPDDQSKEKQTILRCLGAILHVVPTAAISNPNHYVNIARKIAEDINRKEIVNIRKQPVKAAFMNQFENEANYRAHYETTGPEIYNQTNGKIDVFCMSSGTGGKCNEGHESLF